MSPYLLLLAITAMAIADVFDAMQTVYEARGNGIVAGVLCAVNNALTLGVGALGADTLITHGIGQALVLGVAVLATTFVATVVGTKWASKRVKLEG